MHRLGVYGVLGRSFKTTNWVPLLQFIVQLIEGREGLFIFRPVVGRLQPLAQRRLLALGQIAHDVFTFVPLVLLVWKFALSKEDFLSYFLTRSNLWESPRQSRGFTSINYRVGVANVTRSPRWE